MSTRCGMDFAIHGERKGEAIMSHLNDLKNLDADTILGALGVQRKRTSDRIAPAVGGLVVGAMVGAVVALLFTRKSGAERRQDLTRRVDKVLHPSPSLSPSPSISPEATGQFRPGKSPSV
jgi:YtxH-like protein